MEPNDSHDNPSPATDSPDVETPEEGADEVKGRRADPARQPLIGAQALLTKKTDFAARPGFRNPANARSKATKKKGRQK